jgi:DNA mismatch repair protein MSH2
VPVRQHSDHPIAFSTCVADVGEAEPQFPVEVTDEGIRTIEDFVQTWASMREGNDLDADVIMTDPSPEGQIEQLKECFERFRPGIEGNMWVQSVIASL